MNLIEVDMSSPICAEPLVSILETSLDGIFTIDQDGIIIAVNSAGARMFGWEDGGLVGRNITAIIPSPVKDNHDSFLAGFKPDRPFSHVLGSGQWLDAQRKDGSLLPVEVGLSTFLHQGRRYFTGFVRDMSERRAAEEIQRHLATHDPVTGLPNSRLMVETVDRALDRKVSFSLIMVGIKGFLRVGEQHGRLAEEHVLRTVATRIRGAVQTLGLAARMDGEMFAVMAEELADPRQTAEDLCALIRQPIGWGTVDIHLAAAAGVVLAGQDHDSADNVLHAAYVASGYSRTAKLCGGVSIFTPELGARLAREARMEERLRHALANDGLSLALQPKVRVVDGVVLGAEALVRWTDEELGTVGPAEFVPLAERSGLIGALGKWVMQRSLQEAASWQRDGLDLTVAVNMSAVDLRQPNLAALIGGAIGRSGVDPARLVVELTETAVADDPEQAYRQLCAIKDLGVSLSLDDFGTGYSSLSYLRRFPIDTLKIDRSFVIDIPHDSHAAAVVRTIQGLAHTLGMETVAEGVETEAQATFLRGIGVPVIQGYLYSKPLPPERFRALAESGPIGVSGS